MNYILTPEILENFPMTTIGIIPLRNIDNTNYNKEILELLRSEEEKQRKEFLGKTISEHPKIKIWREAFSTFGAKPKKYHCSIEAMLKRIAENEQIPDINPIVNLYNYTSLKYLISIGGDDADKIGGNIYLTLAKGNEPFQELGSKEATNPHEGEAIFKDDKEVLCRRWNWHQCEKTKITEQSKNTNLQIESISHDGKQEITETINELMHLLKKHFKAEPKLYFINKESPSAKITEEN